MDGKPKMIYSDEEGSLFSSTITDYLDEEQVELHTHYKRTSGIW